MRTYITFQTSQARQDRSDWLLQGQSIIFKDFFNSFNENMQAILPPLNVHIVIVLRNLNAFYFFLKSLLGIYNNYFMLIPGHRRMKWRPNENWKSFSMPARILNPLPETLTCDFLGINQSLINLSINGLIEFHNYWSQGRVSGLGNLFLQF